MSYLLEFVRDAKVLCHNNSGEREIRSICVKRRMSGGMRSVAGSRTCAWLKGVHETTRRKRSDFLRLVAVALAGGRAGQFSRGLLDRGNRHERS